MFKLYLLSFIIGIIIYYILNIKNGFSISSAFVGKRDDTGWIMFPAYKSESISEPYYFRNEMTYYDIGKDQSIIKYNTGDEIVNNEVYFFSDDIGNDILFHDLRSNNYIITNDGNKSKEYYKNIDATYLFNGIYDLNIKSNRFKIIQNKYKIERLYNRMKNI